MYLTFLQIGGLSSNIPYLIGIFACNKVIKLDFKMSYHHCQLPVTSRDAAAITLPPPVSFCDTLANTPHYLDCHIFCEWPHTLMYSRFFSYFLFYTFCKIRNAKSGEFKQQTTFILNLYYTIAQSPYSFWNEMFVLE